MSEVADKIDTPDAAAMKAGIATVQTAIVEFDKIAAGLAALEAAHPKDVACDVRTAAGMKQAIAGRAAYRSPRIALEAARKAAKAPLLTTGREIDAFAKSVEKRLLEGESHYDDQIKAEESRKEAEREAKIEAERERVAGIQERIAELRGHPSLPMQSALIAEHISDLRAIVVDESFQEFMVQAEAVRTQGIARLQALHDEALAREQEAKRLADEAAALAAERAELERQRVEDERQRTEARRIDAERVAAEEAERKRVQAIEDARLAEERRIAREKQEAEDAERRRLQKIEDDRVMAERAKAQAEHEAAMKAEREAAEAERQRVASEAAAIQKQKDEAAEAERKRIAAEAAEAQRQKDEAAAAERARLAEIERDRNVAMHDAVVLVREIANSESGYAGRAAQIIGRIDA